MRRTILSSAKPSRSAVWLLLGFGLFVSPCVMQAQVGAETRFNPPLEGVYAGLRVSPESEGLVVSMVVPDSPAGRAGLRVFDVVESLDGEAIDRDRPVADFIARIRERRAGAVARLLVRREGDRHEIELRLGRDLDRAVLRLRKTIVENRLFAEGDASRDEVLDEFDRILAEATTTNEAAEALNRAVGRFGVSHFAVMPAWSQSAFLAGEKSSEARFHLGFFLEPIDIEGQRHWFVRSLMPGSAASTALRVGDELVQVNGLPFADSPRRILAGFEAFHPRHAVRVDRGDRVRLEVRRREAGPLRPVILVNDQSFSGFEATRASVKLLETSAGPVGYMHFWNLLSRDLPRLLERARWGALRSARGLVIDLRGRGGAVNVLLTVGEQLLEDGRPLAVLIDREARSAKEVLAHRLKGQSGVVLYGERSAGAVRGGLEAELSENFHAMVPSHRLGFLLRLTDGVDLERNGVYPDVDVPAILPWAEGRDPILERALDDFAERLLREPRRSRL